jgi:hypothetical protein
MRRREKHQTTVCGSSGVSWEFVGDIGSEVGYAPAKTVPDELLWLVWWEVGGVSARTTPDELLWLVWCGIGGRVDEKDTRRAFVARLVGSGRCVGEIDGEGGSVGENSTRRAFVARLVGS